MNVVGWNSGRDYNITLVGMEQVVRNLNEAISRQKFVTAKALLEAAEFIKKEAQARTPVDRDWLRSHAQTSSEGSMDDPDNFKVAIAYMEEYAVYVHEIPAKHEGAPFVDWKYLERAITDNYQRIYWIIWAESRLGK